MSDLKLFRTTSSGVAELPGGAMALEKSLQTLFGPCALSGHGFTVAV